MNPVPTLIASRYRVVRELGRGGMGVVYVVEHTRTGDQMALKLLHGAAAQDPQAIERFRREARASARIKSENVVKVVDADVAPELGNAPFLVMELLDGTDLQRKVEREGRMPPDKVMHFLVQAARALDKSHGVGIIHRDLKPENLFAHRREDGSTMLKVLDFGISKILGGQGVAGDMASSGMTNTGAVMGTPLYMAPEQARGRVSEIAPTTDVWAMGLIGLFLLTGEIYWRANTVAELMVQILSDPMYPPTQRWSWLPQAIDAWFARSCSREPNERFASVGQQVQALGAALGASAGQAFQRESSLPGALPVPAAAVTAPSPVGASTTAATAGDAPEIPRASRAPLVVVMAAVLVAAAAGSVLLVRGRAKATQDTAAIAAPPPAVAASIAPESTPAPPQTVTPTPVAAPTAAATQTTPSVTSPALPAATHQGHQAGHTPSPTAALAGQSPAQAAAASPPTPGAIPAPPPAAAPTPKPTANCNPPYVIDSAGLRKYKPECL